MLTRESLRQKFIGKGLTYKDIQSTDINKLIIHLLEELNSFKNGGFRMKLRLLREKDINENPDGSIQKLFLMVDGWMEGEKPYFNRREAISFNQDGFIGFAGWADNRNVQPFLNAFDKWVDSIPAHQGIRSIGQTLQ